MKAGLDETQTADVLDLAARLRERQAQKDDPNVLPRVALTDIPAEIPSPIPDITQTAAPHYRYTAGTNGLVTSSGSVSCPRSPLQSNNTCRL